VPRPGASRGTRRARPGGRAARRAASAEPQGPGALRAAADAGYVEACFERYDAHPVVAEVLARHQGDRRATAAWFERPAAQLRGWRPREVMDTPDGADEIRAIFVRIGHDVYE